MSSAQQRAETTKASLCEYCTCYDSLDAFIHVTHFKSAHNFPHDEGVDDEGLKPASMDLILPLRISLKKKKFSCKFNKHPTQLQTYGLLLN